MKGDPVPTCDEMEDSNLGKRHMRLRHDEMFSLGTSKGELADTDRVKARLNREIEVFSS